MKRVRKKDQISLILGNRPLTVARRLPNPGESQNFMPPETFEFVEMLLDLARPAPRSRVFHKVENELFHRARRLPLIEGGPDSSPLRRQSSEAEDIAVPGDPDAQIRRIHVTDKFQQPHQCEERVAGDPPGAKSAVKLKAGIVH